MTASVKFSQFNVFTNYKDKHFVSNTLSKSLIELDEQHYKIISSGDPNKLLEISESVDFLRQQGIVVDSELDEIGALRFAYQQSKNSTNEIEVVVAPTMACNFRCDYCFETSRSGKMISSVQKKTLEYLEHIIQEKAPKKLRFVWFGGEPLLCIDIISEMSLSICNICNQNNVVLNMIVITNGYLLSEDVMATLELSGINHIQITVDGDKDVHDCRRKLKSGGGTFDRIIGNLRNLCGYNITVGIRVNIDKKNIGQFEKVKSIIESIGNPNIKCHPALVEPASIHTETQKRSYFCNECKEYYNLPDIRLYYLDRNLKNMGLQLCYCGAEHNHSLAIDELGNIYKCWNSIGYDKEIMSTVFTPGKTNAVVVGKYLGRDPFTESDCMNCPYIPVCGGGCIIQRYVTGFNSCSAQKYIYETVIKKEIDSRSN